MTLTAIATDNIGTASVSPGHDIIVDTTAPTVNSASVNVGESSIVVTFSEELGLTSLGVNTFTNFTLSGTAAIVTTVSTAGNTLTLTLGQGNHGGHRDARLERRSRSLHRRGSHRSRSLPCSLH